MATDILQRFLTRKLLNIGGEDERLKRVRKAAKELCQELVANPDLVMNCVLVAFDPEVPPDEPVLIKVASVVENHWNTYASCFSDVPRTLFRAVLLEALRQALEQHHGIAAAIILLGRNMLPHLQLKGEQEVWTDMLENADRRFEECAEAKWNRKVEIDFPELPSVTSKPLAINAQKCDEGALTERFAAAVGPSDGRNQTLPNANPHWTNQHQVWAFNFAPRAASAVARAIEDTLKGAVVKPEPGNPILTLVRDYLESAAAAVTAAMKDSDRRNQLLWWRSALYSPSARSSYRKFPRVVAAALMALDLSQQVPCFHPRSVECFLAESVDSMFDNPPSSQPFYEFLAELVRSDACAPLRDAASEFGQSRGRAPAVTLVANSSTCVTITPDQFCDTLGLDRTVALTPSGFAVWLFRELQAARALKSKVITSAEEAES